MAVKAPPYMPPITRVNSAATAHTSRNATDALASVARGCGQRRQLGIVPGYDGDRHNEQHGEQDAGQMPARNSLPIDCSVRNP